MFSEIRELKKIEKRRKQLTVFLFCKAAINSLSQNGLDLTTKRIIWQEFIHGLNRRKLLNNDDVNEWLRIGYAAFRT